MAENRTPVYRITEKSAFKNAPPHILRELAINKEQFEEGEWEVTLTPTKMAPFLRYCADRRLRTYAWNKWVTIAGWASDSMTFCNGTRIDGIVNQSYMYAKNLGFKNVADHQFCNKMAGSADAVRQFIDLMYRRFLPTFKSRYDNWVEYGQAHELISGTVSEKDLFYLCPKEADNRYNVDFLRLMKHFPFWQTFENITTILTYLFNLKFEDVSSDEKLERCHPTCRIYAVSDQTTGEHLGRLYIDPFMRSNKRSGWKTLLGRMQNPMRRLDKIVYLIGAANEPDSDGNSFLHYEQLQALLFQLGRSIQLLLSEVPYREIAIPWEPQYYAWGGRVIWRDEYAMDWDAVNMFPEFLKFFVYKPALLSQMSSPHAVTEAILTEEKAEAPAFALQRGAFWEAYRCLFWADFDLTLFSMKRWTDRWWREIYVEKYEKYFPWPIDNNYPQFQGTNFTPIFSNPVFHCMYYRKLWTEMLALDMHETFALEHDEPETAERLKNTLLRKGAGEPQNELYMRFMGRDPSIGAILDFYTNPILSLASEEIKKLGSNYV